MERMWVCDIASFLIWETGWSLEYVGQLSYKQALALFLVLRTGKDAERYFLSRNFAMVIATWANANSKRKFKIEDFVGPAPERAYRRVTVLNKQKNLVIKLADEKDYEIAPLDLNMIEAVEDKFDKPFTELFAEGKMRVTYIKAIMFVCLKKNYPDMTEEQVGELVTMRVVTEDYEKIIAHII